MQHETDVFIVGGGPAGLSAAIAASQQGFRVLLADVSLPPIDKCCGEGLMPDSLQALSRLGISLEDTETGEFTGIRFVGKNASVQAKFPEGMGKGIRRTLLHTKLVCRAADLGVSMLWGTQVEVSEQQGITINGERVRYKWLIGADGNDSRIRRFARLDVGSAREKRVGLRRRFTVRPWSQFVEIYWGDDCQVYVTPIAREEVCVAVIAQNKPQSFESALEQFPELQTHLSGAVAHTPVKGALTISRSFPSVTARNIALIGEASGSADAITGEGLALCVRQAIALGHALKAADLSIYEREHRRIMSLPRFMSRAMLLMDKSAWVRKHTMQALSVEPRIFNRMLSVHVGAIPLLAFGIDTAVNFGWRLLTA